MDRTAKQHFVGFALNPENMMRFQRGEPILLQGQSADTVGNANERVEVMDKKTGKAEDAIIDQVIFNENGTKDYWLRKPENR